MSNMISKCQLQHLIYMKDANTEFNIQKKKWGKQKK